MLKESDILYSLQFSHFVSALKYEEALVVGITMVIPGISAAIDIGNSVEGAGTTGFNDIFWQNPVEINDRFGVGSITKTFAATIILQLVAEGKLDLGNWLL